MATKNATKKKTVKTTKTAPKKEVKHITPELIADVRAGVYGTEGERSRKLTAAGYNPSAVTKKLNELKKLVPELKVIFDKAGAYSDVLTKMATAE